MPVHDQSQNDFEDVVQQTGSDASQNLSLVDQGPTTLHYQREIDRRYADLPAAQAISESNINFLGSSFSGSDIRVIAHMYDEIPWKDDRITEITHNRDVAQEVVNGCTSLIGGGFTALSQQHPSNENYATQREYFIAAAGIATSNPAGDEAANILAGALFRFNGFSFLDLARTRTKAELLRRENSTLLEVYNNQLRQLEDTDRAGSSSTIELGTLQTISVQSFRAKHAVRSCGHVNPKGFTRGVRTLGGSCIFTIFDENALSLLIRRLGPFADTPGEREELSTLLPDQLPPLDLTVLFANEYGALSDFRLYGVEFFTDGSVFSIEDLLSEETMNFVCRDADVMTKRGRISISRLSRGMFNGKDDKDIAGTSLLFDNQDYYNHLERLGVRRRLIHR